MAALTDGDGVFSRIIKRTISSGEITEEVNVKKDPDCIIAEYVVGKYKLIQRIDIEGHKAISKYTETNTYLKTEKSGTQTIEYSDGLLTDYLNGALAAQYSFKSKWIKSASGGYVFKYSGNNIYTDNGVVMKIDGKSAGITVIFAVEPRILPPDVYTISQNFGKMHDMNIIINYLVLPNDLRFLLML